MAPNCSAKPTPLLGDWTQFSFVETGTGSDTLMLSFRDDPGYIALDNISVSSGTATTPEPTGLILVSSGVLALAEHFVEGY